MWIETMIILSAMGLLGTQWGSCDRTLGKTQTRYEKLQLLATCEVLTAGLLYVEIFWDVTLYCWASSSDVSTDGRDWVTMKTEALLSLEASGLLAPAQRHGVIPHITGIFTASYRGLALSTTLPEPQKTRYHLNKQFKASSSCTCTRVQTCSRIITRLPMVRSVTLSRPSLLSKCYAVSRGAGIAQSI